MSRVQSPAQPPPSSHAPSPPTSTTTTTTTTADSTAFDNLRLPDAKPVTMPPQYKSAPAARITVPLAPLTAAAFAPFGTVIENPKAAAAAAAATVNQGTAAKYPSISPFVAYPPPSGQAGTPRLNLFVCNPRTLTDGGRTFTVEILERHPYSTQTFIPIGLGAADTARGYLVIVAPTTADDSTSNAAISSNASSTASTGAAAGLVQRLWNGPQAFPRKMLRNIRADPVPENPVAEGEQRADAETDAEEEKRKKKKAAVDTTGTTRQKGRGLPELSGLRAFLCRGDQAVTYGVGTWHAPMVVLGDGPVEFVVAMNENGVAVEDCEECEVVGGRVKVVVDAGAARAKL